MYAMTVWLYSNYDEKENSECGIGARVQENSILEILLYNKIISPQLRKKTIFYAAKII